MAWSDEHPLSGAEIARRLAAAAPQRPVVVTGRYSPKPQVERMFVFDERRARLVNIIDEWVTVETLDEVLQSLSTVGAATGGCSAMYATRAKYVWASRDGELRLWCRRRLVARFAGGRIDVSRAWGWSSWPLAQTRVRAYLSGTWFERGVRLEQQSGRTLTIARERELSAWLDPTYDGIDLMCDAAWATALAQAIAEASGVPLEVDEDLR
jgi:hypothetical protein